MPEAQETVTVIPGSALLWRITPRPANSAQVNIRHTLKNTEEICWTATDVCRRCLLANFTKPAVFTMLSHQPPAHEMVERGQHVFTEGTFHPEEMVSFNKSGLAGIIATPGKRCFLKLLLNIIPHVNLSVVKNTNTNHLILWGGGRDLNWPNKSYTTCTNRDH